MAGRGEGALQRLIDAQSTRAQRVQALRDLGSAVGRSVTRPDGLADAVTKAAPTLTPRTLRDLRETYGSNGPALAEEIVNSASHATAAIGAAGGVLASLSEAAPMSLLTAPVQMGVESLAVIAVELRMIAELHLVLGHRVPTDPLARTALMLRSWTTGRAANLADLASGPAAGQILGRASRTQFGRQIRRRFARSTVGFVPLLAGAAAGAALNARSTQKLGHSLIDDLAPRGR